MKKNPDPRNAMLNARSHFASEERRLAAAKNAIERATEEIATTSPDDERAFGKLVARRDAARALAEAIEIHVAKAREALSAAEAEAAKAEREAREAASKGLREEIISAEAEITKATFEFRARLGQLAAEQRERVAKLNGIEGLLGTRLTSPSYWATHAMPGREFLAARAQPEVHDADERAVSAQLSKFMP